jgi:hypothetical protein
MFGRKQLKALPNDASRWPTHGTAATLRWSGPQIREYVLNRTGFTVGQDSGSDNWFYLQMTAPTLLQGRPQALIGMRVKIYVNENARLEEVRVSDESRLVYERNFQIIGQDFTFEDLPRGLRSEWSGGLLMSIHVSFLSGDPNGVVRLQSATVITRSS